MALDSFQNRGSVINVTLPFRSFRAVPTGTVTVAERQSILTFPSDPAWSAYVPPAQVIGEGIRGTGARPTLETTAVIGKVKARRRARRLRRKIKHVVAQIQQAAQQPAPKPKPQIGVEQTPISAPLEALPPVQIPEIVQPYLPPALPLAPVLQPQVDHLANLIGQLSAIEQEWGTDDEDALVEILLLVA